MQFLKRQLPIAVAFIVGLVLWAVFYMPSTAAQEVQQSFTAWAIILSGAALILGILSAIHHHWSKVSTQKPGYGYSLITIFCFLRGHRRLVHQRAHPLVAIRIAGSHCNRRTSGSYLFHPPQAW